MELKLPLNVPDPKTVFVAPAVPMVSVLPLISNTSEALLKLIALPPNAALTNKSLSNCTVVLPDIGANTT